MTRNASHDLHTLSQTDPATEQSATAVVANDATDESTAVGAVEPAATESMSLTMRVLAWLPLHLWTDCGVCLFWRGAVVGAVAAGAAIAVVQALV